MALATAAGGAAVAAYLEAKFHLSKDFKLLRLMRRIGKETTRRIQNGEISPWYMFEEQVAKYPTALCIWTRERSWTWQQVNDEANRYAHYFLSQGVQPRQLVALYLQNCAEFLFIWLGLLSIGCAPASVNYSLGGDALVHCLKISGAEMLIADADEKCLARVRGVQERLRDDLNMTVQVLDQSLKAKIAGFPAAVVSNDYRKAVQLFDPVVLLYTSGTTGMPKAAAFSTWRWLTSGAWVSDTYDRRSGPDGERWYICLPMFHGTAGLTSIFSLLGGQAVAISKRFSTSGFWPDVVDSESTFFCYVGETLRYLMAAPPSPLEKAHKIRAIYGNGLRPDVWDKVRSRFAIDEIIEFFNSTEGGFAMVNRSRNDFLAHAVGHDGALFRSYLKNVRVPVKVDPVTNTIERDPATGLAVRASYEEGGEILILHPNPTGFEGYWRDEKATNARIVYDILKKGDSFYRTGDALRRDGDGRWFFLDRLGDTFRWKSENVATATVSEAVGRFQGILDVNVYGVLVPSHDGRAGCAAVLLDRDDSQFDFAGLTAHLQGSLARYAVPVFLRVVKASSNLENNKQSKVGLREEGVNLEAFGSKVEGGKEDVVYWLPPKGNRYVRFTGEDLAKLKGGEARL